jgi:hypothetical protein
VVWCREAVVDGQPTVRPRVMQEEQRLTVSRTQQTDAPTAHRDNVISNGHIETPRPSVEACSPARCRRGCPQLHRSSLSVGENVAAGQWRRLLSLTLTLSHRGKWDIWSRSLKLHTPLLFGNAEPSEVSTAHLVPCGSGRVKEFRGVAAVSEKQP